MEFLSNAGAGDDWLASEGTDASASAGDDWLASEGAGAGVGIEQSDTTPNTGLVRCNRLQPPPLANALGRNRGQPKHAPVDTYPS